jgi:hypothetical protein
MSLKCPYFFMLHFVQQIQGLYGNLALAAAERVNRRNNRASPLAVGAHLVAAQGLGLIEGLVR